MSDIQLKDIGNKIGLLKQTAEELRQMGAEFPALEKNTIRILATIKMLEINISDVIEC